MSFSLAVNDHHQANILNYIRFARYQRSQRLRSINACFKDLQSGRLADETTFTIDEVDDILQALQADIRTEVEAELLHTAHTNVLLLRQLFQQAEKWHLKLATDIGELENRELLEQIRQFEEREFSGTNRDEMKAVLAPINESGGSALLKLEIERLQEENEILQSRIRQVESQAVAMGRAKAQLAAELDRALGAGSAAKVTANLGGDFAAMEREVNRLRGEVDASRRDGARAAEWMEGDLADTKHELLKIRAMLEMAEKELEQKVSETTPFKNLKQMLQKKNEQIKDLRRRLGRYEDVE